MKGHLFPGSVDVHELSLSHWGYTCITHLASIVWLLLCICMYEKKLKSLRGCGSSGLQRIGSLLQRRTRYQTDAYFFTAHVFFVWATDHCTGISSIGVAAVITAYSFEGTCAYKTQQAGKADEHAVHKGPVWPAEVQRLGTEEWAAWQDKGFSKNCAPGWAPGRWGELWLSKGCALLEGQGRWQGEAKGTDGCEGEERKTAGREWC